MLGKIVSDDRTHTYPQEDMFMRTFLVGAALSFCVFCWAGGAKGGDVRPARPEPPPVKVSHESAEGDWLVAQTLNFRIHHHQSRTFAEKMARTAESTRTELLERWFGEPDTRWPQRCAVYLFDDPQSYSQATGAPAQSPAHTRIDADGGRVLSRTIYLHGATAEMLRSILPHEVTHSVLADHFGRRIPRWADEGMAVLTEPKDRIAGHLRLLPRWRDEGLLVGARQLFEMGDYPPPHAWGSFYAQSVSLVQFLSKEKGPQTFALFLREGLRDGYTPALQHYYGWDFAELDRRWRRHAFAATDEAAP
jgi:hypothetical protein